eukprot:213738-Chlamydomonas_euryale.AAC.2
MRRHWHAGCDRLRPGRRAPDRPRLASGGALRCNEPGADPAGGDPARERPMRVWPMRVWHAQQPAADERLQQWQRSGVARGAEHSSTAVDKRRRVALQRERHARREPRQLGQQRRRRREVLPEHGHLVLRVWNLCGVLGG